MSVDIMMTWLGTFPYIITKHVLICCIFLCISASALSMCVGLALQQFSCLEVSAFSRWSNDTNILSVISASLLSGVLSVMGVSICTIVVSNLSNYRSCRMDSNILFSLR